MIKHVHFHKKMIKPLAHVFLIVHTSTSHSNFELVFLQQSCSLSLPLQLPLFYLQIKVHYIYFTLHLCRVGASCDRVRGKAHLS